jgi:hypothetical protein
MPRPGGHATPSPGATLAYRCIQAMLGRATAREAVHSALKATTGISPLRRHLVNAWRVRVPWTSHIACRSGAVGQRRRTGVLLRRDGSMWDRPAASGPGGPRPAAARHGFVGSSGSAGKQAAVAASRKTRRPHAPVTPRQQFSRQAATRRPVTRAPGSTASSSARRRRPAHRPNGSPAGSLSRCRRGRSCTRVRRARLAPTEAQGAPKPDGSNSTAGPAPITPRATGARRPRRIGPAAGIGASALPPALVSPARDARRARATSTAPAIRQRRSRPWREGSPSGTGFQGRRAFRRVVSSGSPGLAGGGQPVSA